MPPRPLGAVGRALKLRSHRLIETRRGMRAMPCSPVGVRLRDRSLRPMRRAPSWRSCADAARYTAERTSGCRNRTRIPNSINAASSAGLLALPRIPSWSAARHNRLDVADRLGRRHQEQELCLPRKGLDPLRKGFLHAAGQRPGVGKSEPAR